jgi:hypothetical protein
MQRRLRPVTVPPPAPPPPGVADARLLLARAIGDIQAVLAELADLNDQLRAR